jgi:hypothetical protein
MSLYQEILYNFCGAIASISMISGVTLFPLVFTRSIVPGIEKKIGQKLGYYSPMYKRMPIGKVLGRHNEIATYITVNVLSLCIG